MQEIRRSLMEDFSVTPELVTSCKVRSADKPLLLRKVLLSFVGGDQDALREGLCEGGASWRDDPLPDEGRHGGGQEEGEQGQEQGGGVFTFSIQFLFCYPFNFHCWFCCS